MVQDQDSLVSVTQSGFATGSNRFIRKSNQSNFSIVPILLNKEVWTKLGSCYKVQGRAGMILSPVPCYGGARPLHNVWTQYTASWRGSVIITMVLLWWGMVVCRHSRQYQTCKPYLTMFGMRTIIGDVFTSYKLGPSHLQIRQDLQLLHCKEVKLVIKL